MRNNESGEFELLMGNRQLLSGFFIVALLFGVAFAMGYIVGRNSAPSAKAQAEAASAGPVNDARPPASLAPAPQTAPATTASKEPLKTGEVAPPDAAVQATPRPAAAAPAPEPAAPGAASDVSAIPEPAAGNYWQLMAVKPQVAEVVVRTLQEKGFPAILGPAPKNLVRVLVGPYADRDRLGKAKADLENAGFHPILKK